MSMWEILETGENTTMATEVPGVGCVLAIPGVGAVFVPRTRLVMLKEPKDGATHVITRDDRNSAPLRAGLSAAEIRSKQPEIVDPGGQQYIVHDVDDATY